MDLTTGLPQVNVQAINSGVCPAVPDRKLISVCSTRSRSGTQQALADCIVAEVNKESSSCGAVYFCLLMHG